MMIKDQKQSHTLAQLRAIICKKPIKLNKKKKYMRKNPFSILFLNYKIMLYQCDANVPTFSRTKCLNSIDTYTLKVLHLNLNLDFLY